MLFEDGPVIELSPAMDERNSAQNGRYIFHIHEELTKQMSAKYFTRHSGIIALGVLLTFALALPLAATAHGGNSSGAVLFTLWILFCGLIIGMMLELSFASAWKNALRTRTGWIKMLPGTAAIAIFVSVIGFLLTKLVAVVSPVFALVLVAFLLINLAWGPRLKRKTALGQTVGGQIAGFRMFLEKVEQERLNRLNPTEETPQQLDRFLPYIIALEVKDAWGDHLAQAFFATTTMVEG